MQEIRKNTPAKPVLKAKQTAPATYCCWMPAGRRPDPTAKTIVPQRQELPPEAFIG